MTEDALVISGTYEGENDESIKKKRFESEWQFVCNSPQEPENTHTHTHTHTLTDSHTHTDKHTHTHINVYAYTCLHCGPTVCKGI